MSWEQRGIAAVLWLVALVAYIATARLGRRSPHYGTGARILSWVGLLVPCAAWFAIYLGWSAVDRAAAESAKLPPAGAVARTRDRSRYIVAVLVYVFALVAGGAVARG